MANIEDPLNRIPPPDETPSSPPHPERRKFFAKIITITRDVVFPIICALTATTAAGLRINELRTQTVPAELEKSTEAIPEKRNWRPGEFTNNKVNNYMVASVVLDPQHILLIDQNGNPVTGQPIPIPDEIFKHSNEQNYPQIFQVWLDGKRRELKEKYPGLHVNFDENQREPTLIKNGYNFEVVWQNSQQPVSPKNKMSRYEFAEKVFKEMNFPPALAELLLGACAVESLFSENMENKSGAKGYWQIMPREGRNQGLIGERRIQKIKVVVEKIWKTIVSSRGENKVLVGAKKRRLRRWFVESFDHRDDFEKSTPAAARILVEKYGTVLNNPYVQNIQKQYALSDEDFAYLAAVNSYQAGEGVILPMCKWFSEQYSPEKIKEIFGKGPYGKDIYTFMTLVYFQSGLDSHFGTQSRDYVLKALAMRKLFALRKTGKKPEFVFSYNPPGTMKSEDHLGSSAVQKGILSHGKTIGVGAVAGAIIGMGLESHGRPLPITRRVLLGTAIGTVTAYVGRYTANLLEDNVPPDKK